jgi:hypothetical protein
MKTSITQRFLVLVLFAVTGCAAPPSLSTQEAAPFHVVLGSNNYGYPASQVQLVSSVQGERFETRHSRLRYPECMSGYLEFVEFSGFLDSSAVAAMGGLVQNIKPCVRKNGSRAVSPVYMNSAQGELALGMQVGQWFKTQSIELVVTEGQLCESACAVAFLGASFKRVQATGRAVLHFNGELGRGLDCARSTDMMPLKSYLLSVKGNQSGQILYNQALTYCRNSKGWDLS